MMSIRVRDIAVTIGPTAGAFTGMTVDYDVTVAGVTTSKTWSGAVGAGLPGDL